MRTTSSVAPAVLALAAASTGCALRFTHRCDVPTPVVAAAPGPRIPAAVGVRLEPAAGGPAERFEERDPHHRWGVDPVPPTAAMLDRLAASAFERVAAGPAGADLLLEARVEDLHFEWTPVGFGPYSARVGYQVTVRPRDGPPLTTFRLSGEGARGAVLSAVTHCAGIGDAVALAIQDAGTRLLAALSADPALAGWIAARGGAVPSLAALPAAAFAEAAPESRPVTAPPPGPPVRRSAHASGGMGAFFPAEKGGALEGAGTGLASFITGEARFNGWLAVAADGGWYAGSWSRATVAPGVQRGLEVERGFFLGLGPRLFLPGEQAEPWVGVSPCLVVTRVQESFSLQMTRRDWPETWSAGLLLAAGLRFYPGGPLAVGLEVRRLFAPVTLGDQPGKVDLGGWTLGASAGLSMPP